MYRIMTYHHGWQFQVEPYDCLEDALQAVHDLAGVPWRIQEWIDIRMDQDQSWWNDCRNWQDGQ